jgi:hypothetical protein
VASSFQILHPNFTCILISCSMLHVPPISPSSKRTNYEAPHCALVLNLPSLPPPEVKIFSSAPISSCTSSHHHSVCRSREVQHSILGSYTDYDNSHIPWFYSVLPDKCCDSALNSQRPVPCTSVPSHHSQSHSYRVVYNLESVIKYTNKHRIFKSNIT